jgi:integrase
VATPKMAKTREPGIYKRGGRYVHVWHDRGRQRKEFFRTMAEAREAKRQRQGGDRRKRPRIRFRDYAAEWIESYRGRSARGFQEGTRAEYRRDIDSNLSPFFGGYWLSDVDPPDVRDWFAWMEDRGASASAIRKAKAALSALYATAKEDGTVRDNPVSGVRYVPSQGVRLPRKIEPLTLAEFDRLRAALSAEWRLFFVVLAHTGLRVSELLGRRWKDIDLRDDPSMVVHDQVYEGKRKGLKTDNARRRLPLSPALARALQEWRQRMEYPEDESPVFPSSVGTQLNYSNLWNRVWHPAKEAARISDEHYGAFHRLRKTLGSVIHESGQKSGRQLSDWLGHADIAFTQRVYVGQMDSGLGDAEFLDELIPVEGWATNGQHPTRRRPQNGNGSPRANPHQQADTAQQPRTTAEPLAES